MNLFSSRLVLRPRLLTEVLDLAAPLALANASLLGRVALAVLAPLAGLAVALRLGLGWGWPALWAVLLPLSWITSGAFTATLGEALFQPPDKVRVGPVLGHFMRRLPVMLAARVVSAVVLLGCASILVPLPIEGPRWLFLGEAVVLEQASPAQAIRRSRSLSRNRLGFCLGLALAVLLLPVLTLVLADLVGNAIVAQVLQMGRPFGDLWENGGSGLAVVGLLIGVPLAACARFLGYIDLRTRKEGWDIQLRFTAWSEREKEAGRQRWAA